jgi:hypothetical protein
MKTLRLFLAASITLASAALFAQNAQPASTYVSYPQKCSWRNVTFIQGNDSLRLGTRTAGSTWIAKSDRLRGFADLTPKELKRIKKAASNVYCCTVVVNDRYTPTERFRNPDPSAVAENSERIQFYFVMPMETIEQANSLPPYRQR